MVPLLLVILFYESKNLQYHNVVLIYIEEFRGAAPGQEYHRLCRYSAGIGTQYHPFDVRYLSIWFLRSKSRGRIDHTYSFLQKKRRIFRECRVSLSIVSYLGQESVTSVRDKLSVSSWHLPPTSQFFHTVADTTAVTCSIRI